MQKVLHKLIATSVLLISSHSYAAFYISAEVKSDSIKWDNVTYGIGSNKVPSKWVAPPALRSVQSWSPGAFSVAPPSSITLKGGTNNTDTTSAIPISIMGVQYNTSGIAMEESVNAAGKVCTKDEASLPIITLETTQPGCISGKTWTMKGTSVGSAPFVLFRPVFQINDSDVISALYGKPEGNYSAAVPIVIRYYYKNMSGIPTFRNISDAIIFNFNYDPVKIADLKIISGDGKMTPEYDTVTQRVSSKTSYQLEASGFFHDGIVLRLQSRKYEMVNSQSPDAKIPYSIECGKCSKQKLVDRGTLVNQVTTIEESHSGVKHSITFNLEFKYDVEGETLVSGDYADTVTIMVEPGI